MTSAACSGANYWAREFIKQGHQVKLIAPQYDYIIGYYSQTRPHRYNAGLSPNESERRYWLNSKTVANFT